MIKLLMGEILRRTPQLRGKGYLAALWVRRHPKGRMRTLLPGGASIECDLSQPYEAMVWLRQEEQAELEWLHRTLNPGQCFVDCGANIGLWTLTAARSVGPTGRVLALEANPVTAARLAHNVAQNRLDNVAEVVSVAVGDIPGEALFDPGASHNLGQVSGSGKTKVTMQTLDNLIAFPVDGIKLDIEGFELEALAGAERLLTEDSPWLMIEFNTLVAGVNRLGDWEVHRLLRTYDYKAYGRGSGFSWDVQLSDDWVTPGYRNLLYIHE